MALLAVGYALAFFAAPETPTRATSRRSPTLHVPLATCALIGFVVAAVHAIRHLRSGDPVHDARAYVSIHISVIFGLAVLATGAIWAKGSGALVGVEGAHLVSFLIVFLLYATYYPLPLRDRGPRSAGALRLGVRDHGRGIRAAQFPRRPARRAADSSADLLVGRRPARLDALPVPRLLVGMAALWATLVWFELDSKRTSGDLARIRRALEVTA